MFACFYPMARAFTSTLVAMVVWGFVDPAQPLPDGYRGGAGRSAADWIASVIGGRQNPEAVYFALEPPLVATVTDRGLVRYLELRVSVRAEEEATVAEVKRLEPVIHSGLLNVLYGREVSTLRSPAAMESLRQECLAEARRVLAKETRATAIADLYFTEFFFQ
jgi:flagellar basal body-associated protein FliL